MRFVALAVLSLTLVAPIVTSSPSRAIELQPGLWQETEVGSENGKPASPKAEMTCMTPEDAKNPLRGFSPGKEMRGHCKVLDVKQKADGIFIHMTCGDPKQFLIDIAVDYVFTSTRSYAGTVKSTVTLMGQTTTSDKKVEGKWVAATCDKK
jgi:hypothetical protein